LTSQALVRRIDARAPLAALATLTAALLLLILQALPAPAQGLGGGMTADGRPMSFADLAEKVSPAVVDITTSTIVAAAGNGGPLVPDGSPFEDFFRDFLDNNNPDQRQRRSQALGSGFVISADGYIVTNNHVIEGADEIEIEFFSGKRLQAKLVGTDKNTDIALLKVEADEPLAFVTFGDSDHMRVGDWVMAMGNPLGQGFSVSAGIVSARKRALSGSYDDYIQTDAAINRGNSGGPLFNLDGEVIGVNTAILSPNGGSIGIGFSMASNVVSKVVDQLKQYGETRRGWLGVRIQDLTPDVAEAMGLKSTKGALVTDVPPGPALDAGMKSGDVILTYEGESVEDTRDLVRRVGDSPVGAKVDIMVHRDGAELTLAVTLGRREDAEAAAAVPGDTPQTGISGDALGMSLTPLTEEMRADLGLDASVDGLVVTKVEDGSEAAAKGIAEKDVIAEAGQRKVLTLKDLEDRIAEAKDAGRKSLLLLVRRGGAPRFVALSVQ
jgi:serine protease Do